jgi:molecular chaperone GrpE (heat shock protein)
VRRLALAPHFSDTAPMKEASDWNITKWPFLAANAALLIVAVISRAAHPISQTDICLSTGAVALGALLGCLPFILEYRATKKLVEINAVATVAEQLRDLKKYSAQVAAATDQWALVQETTKGNAEKTTVAAREIAARMATEIREFNDFQVKLNDTEKAALRLEVDKLRRTESEWLRVVARILDHIFALHNAAARSGQPELVEQINQFQNACHDAAHRVGLVPFVAAAGEEFDIERHRARGMEHPPTDGVVAETLAPGLTFQGRLVRPALVNLQGPTAPAEAAAETETEPAPAPAATAAPETITAPTAEPAPAPAPEPAPEKSEAVEAAPEQPKLGID